MHYSKEKERDILERWERQALKNGDSQFTYDGLLFRGCATLDEDGNWYYPSGNEEANWKNGASPLLFITKNVNGDPGDDIRTWTGRIKNKPVISGSFFKNLARWVYCINEICNHSTPKSFSVLSNEDIVEALDTLPIARINPIKEAGGGRCPKQYIKSYFKRDGYKDLLKEQIELFSDAEIIMCCGESILDIFSDIFETQWINVNFYKAEKYIYKSTINGEEKIIIKGYHPSYPGRKNSISEKEAYEDLIWNLQAALESMPIIR